MRHRCSSWLLSMIIVSGCADMDTTERAAIEPSSAVEPRLEPRLGGGIEAQLYPAELVMDHQAALGLDDAQDAAIRAELQSAQRELVDAEWALRRERETLAGLLASERVDEVPAMEAAERVIEHENAIKRLHLRLLIRIKNQLSIAQRARLDALRTRQ